jgi:MFS family permease
MPKMMVSDHMTNIAVAAPSPFAADQATQLRRAIVASTIGTTIEWYDFYIYTIATGLVFAKLFFPESDPLTGTLQAFAVYAVGFVSRPIGAVIFGHYGDRIGRKSTLIVTLMLTGIATFLVALVPTYDSVGVWGAVFLTLLRFMQGIGVGGEWGGSVLLSMEWCKTNGHRGFVAAWPQFGSPAGLFLANLAILAFSQMSGEAFLSWGWRLPFLFSLLLVMVGLYIRLGIMDTPIFTKLVAENKIERTPILQVIRTQPKEILLTALVRLGQQAPGYIFISFIFSYGTEILKVPRDFLLVAVLAASSLSLVTTPLFGCVSDRIGRRKMYARSGACRDSPAVVRLRPVRKR